MLRHRQSMKSKPALSHRKSTSSARSVVLEHLDPAMAQRDAQIAAHQAFARAQDRSSAEIALFPLPPSQSPLRQPYPQDASTRDESAEVHTGADNTPSMPRRQSVRFVGPCTVQNRGSAGRQRPRTPASIVSGAVDPANIVESTDGQSLTVPTLHHPQARPGTSASTHSSKAVSNYLQALAAEDDVYTPEDDIASIPSSYRHLRRSKSLRPSRGPGHARDSGDSYLLPGMGPLREVRTSMSMRTLNSSQCKENVKPQKFPVLKAPKSMSFLKGRRGRISSITSHDSGATTQMNTGPSPIPLRAKTSIFFGSKNRRAESSLRKTLRSSSSHAEIEPSPADTGLPLPKTARGSLRNKARKASKTLKSKLFNLFSSGKGDDEAEFPDQHVKSQKKHTDTEFVSYVTGPDEHKQQCSGDERSLHYNHSNVSDVFLTSHSSRVCSRKASLQALGDQIWQQASNEERALDDKSRVTSWTNSGPSTLTSEQQLAWEKQRLSIIKENGAHCPSPSLRRQAIGKHILQSQESLVGQPILPGPTVDSQRVYAALMERLAETTQLAQVVEQQRKSLAEATPTPLHISSKPDFEEYEDNGAKPAPLTVRRTTSKESLTIRDGDPNIPGGALSNRPGDSKMLSPPITLTPWNGNHGPADGQGVASAERTNAFFGSPEAHLFRTISPYRRALRKSIEEAEDDMHGRNSGDRIISEYGTEIRRPEEAFYEDAYSESVYSSDEPAAGPALNPMQSLTEVVKGPPSSTGNMSMSVDPPVTYRPTGHRVVSSVSSIDWKTWLSANVARLEPSPSPPRPAEIDFALPSMPSSHGQGHVREGAQIEEDEEEGFPRQDGPATHKPTLPISPLTPFQSNASKISPFQKSTFRATPPTADALAEVDNQKSLSERRESFDTPLPSPELPPPIPPRSPLRKNPYPKKRSGFLYTPSVAASNTATSPGLTAAVEKQFGPATTQTVPSGENKENEVSAESHGMRKPGFLGSVNEDRSAKGRRMVDVFLGSRRKRMASSETDSPAFL
ncbi:hypothetical protein CONLIGDRAFT_614451 [Coniochaeta ligniaria NRRL 30616]|uniref:Uncharacterized protein n=1 Tax=Coniochaeta ligniaria NRRL 30616 TaxID=1408157 RepID=A0A1J7ITL1_9PEZI|nr:hypothetical protein CONLIGDRAFT_614451 [Coniochaeta ligniaria NRRL 30616]